jgi:hypothetical protein
VLSLYKAEALKMLLEQLDSYKLDITAIQELRWLGKGVMEKWEQALLSVKKNKHLILC